MVVFSLHRHLHSMKLSDFLSSGTTHFNALCQVNGISCHLQTWKTKRILCTLQLKVGRESKQSDVFFFNGSVKKHLK